MKYQVVFRLADRLRERIKSDGAENLGQEIGIYHQHLLRLSEGTWNDLTRDQMQRLASWARTHNYSPDLFDFNGIHPLWETFAGAPARLIVGSDEHGAPNADDFAAQHKFQKFLAGWKPRPDSIPRPHDDLTRQNAIEKVRALVMEDNCVIICGPRRNPASEVACSLLWGAEPFSTNPDEMAKVPFRLRYHKTQPEELRSTFADLTDDPQARGLFVHGKSLPFPYVAEDRWKHAAKELDFDFAMVAICRKPLGTTNDVTTLVIMGLTGFATLSACESIAAEELPVDSLTDHQPQLRVFCAKFKKGHGQGNRRLTDGCRWVGPPWDNFPPGALAGTTMSGKHRAAKS